MDNGGSSGDHIEIDSTESGFDPPKPLIAVEHRKSGRSSVRKQKSESPYGTPRELLGAYILNYTKKMPAIA